MTETPFLRPVRLPQGIAGELWLGPMPGRRRPFDDDMDDLRARKITRIVSLTPLAEIEEKAPSYAIALGGEINIAIVRFPIADFGIPADEAALFALADEAAQHLSGGGNVFVHCAAGIGRTGTFAICILRALGLKTVEAAALVASAGSGPETDAQKALVDRFQAPTRPRQPAETSP
ncbi:protein-tyrosine phosphatase family protein [Shinella sp.]|jgi:protein-tyrosine phosphatase|uniref:protein-tyrosine phosphatase family protein n=1 Tax=Shinella sp. TaxID=1870904 RepID=UPI003F71D544